MFIRQQLQYLCCIQIVILGQPEDTRQEVGKKAAVGWQEHLVMGYVSPLTCSTGTIRQFQMHFVFAVFKIKYLSLCL